LVPKGGAWGFFGWHLVRPDTDTVIITEGEFDAMVSVLDPGLFHQTSQRAE
jgi:hypothetical protein